MNNDLVFRGVLYAIPAFLLLWVLFYRVIPNIVRWRNQSREKKAWEDYDLYAKRWPEKD